MKTFSTASVQASKGHRRRDQPLLLRQGICNGYNGSSDRDLGSTLRWVDGVPLSLCGLRASGCFLPSEFSPTKNPRFEAPNAAANDSDKASSVPDFKTLIRHSNTFGKVKIEVDVSDIIRITGFSAIIRNHPLICAGSLLHNLEGSDP